MKKLWRLWAKALGEKSGVCDTEADIIAIVRTFLVVFTVLTNFVIVCGVFRHWNGQ